MNNHLTGMILIKKAIAEQCRSRSGRYHGQRELEGLLSLLADQEEEKAGFLGMISEFDQWLPPEGIEPVLEKAHHELAERHGELARLLAEPKSGESELVDAIVALESTRCNRLIISTFNWGTLWMQGARKYAEILEGHHATIATFLNKRPEFHDRIEVIDSLKDVWRRRILFLDDDVMVTRLMTSMLDPFGDITTDTAGEQALLMLDSSRFDLIISDYNMPNMDGIEFFQRAIRQYPDLKEKFIFFSGVQDLKFHHFIIENNVPVLQKPANVHSLYSAVTRILLAN